MPGQVLRLFCTKVALSIPGTAGAMQSAETLGGRAAVADEQSTFERVTAMDAEGVPIEVPLNKAIGAYTELISLPKEVLPEANLKVLERAYRNYEANATTENAAALMQEVRASVRVASQKMGTGVAVDAAVAETVSRLEATQEYIDRVWGVGDNGGVLTLSTRFLNRMDPLWENASKIEPIEGYQDIVCHGDKISLIYRDAYGNEVNVSVYEFAEILKNSPVYEGRPIRLIVCEAGADGSVVAQTLANKLGVEIMAPTDVVYVYPDGTIKIGRYNTGTWKIFKPSGGTE